MLYKEDWARAAQLAGEVIATNKYPLISNSAYVNGWRRKGSPSIDQEAVFLLFARLDITQASYDDNHRPGNSVFGYMATSNDLLDLFDAGDVRGRSTMFITGTNSGTQGIYTRKYQGSSDSANNQKLIRSSELYLNRAEALAEQGSLAEALTDLNRIRQRANPASPPLVIADKQELLDSIFVERRRELCFEGHLFYDIVRKKKNLVRVDCSGSNCSVNYPSPLFACPRPTQR
jgi:hypothetical protein